MTAPAAMPPTDDQLPPATDSGPDAEEMPTWTPELIASLDWLRLTELARAIASEGGCELAGSRILPNGAAVFGMVERPGTAHPQRAIVRLSGWNEWGATPETIARFAQEIRTAQNARGILIAPAGFSPSALLSAQEHRIETVDATTLSHVLQSLPAERSRFFLSIATAGNATCPSCPVCLQKLKRVDNADEEPPEAHVITERGLCAEHVICEHLNIAAWADVEFLYPVQARSMRVAGRATGDFSCDGTITIEPGGMLDGRMAARAIQVDEGGELRGQFRILEGSCLQPFATQPSRWHWRCQGPHSTPGCSGVRFDPHA